MKIFNINKFQDVIDEVMLLEHLTEEKKAVQCHHAARDIAGCWTNSVYSVPGVYEFLTEIQRRRPNDEFIC